MARTGADAPKALRGGVMAILVGLLLVAASHVPGRRRRSA
jgi:hypothetical protein